VVKKRNYPISEEAIMLKKRGLAWAPRIIIVSSMALAAGLADVQSSIAGCGGYCEARQVRAMCHQAINVQGLKAHERNVEFEKCKADPVNYLQIEELTDDTEDSLD
jgi:hypothetical protein